MTSLYLLLILYYLTQGSEDSLERLINALREVATVEGLHNPLLIQKLLLQAVFLIGMEVSSIKEFAHGSVIADKRLVRLLKELRY